MKDSLGLENPQANASEKLFIARKIALYVLLGIIYTAFLGLQLARVQAITNFSYRLHEMFYLPVHLAIFIGPVVFLIYIYFVIKCLGKKDIQNQNLKTTIKRVFVVISLIAVFLIVGYQSHEISTGGIFEIKQKVQEDTKYYLVLQDKKIRVSRNEFNLVNVNESYLISFIWNSLSPDKGKLTMIEPFKN